MKNINNPISGKILLLAGAAMIAVPGVAVAQTEKAQDNAQAEDSDRNFGDIVVTAQRRSELARDVPISITALSGVQLAKAGIVDSVSLGNITPGLRMDRIGNFTIPAIRGITSTITGPGADNNVAIYLDGVYQPEATVNNFDLPDVERVEVLKGPQGTLFGRNATGGAIQVFTKTPGNTVEGNATVSYSSFKDLQVKGYVSAPLIEDKAAFSLATSFRKADSFYRDIGVTGVGDIGIKPRREGVDAKLIRGKLQLTPTENLKILLTGLYSDHLDNSAIFGSALNGNSAVGQSLANPAIIPSEPWTMASESKPFQRSKVFSLSGKIEYDFGGGTLSSLSSFSEFKNFSLLDSDYAQSTNGSFANFEANSTNRNFTQELNYVSKNDGALNYSLGLFYSDGWAGWSRLGLRSFDGVNPASQFGLDIYGHQKITSYAGFGEAYYDVTDKLKVIVGARYTNEKRSLTRAFVGPNADPTGSYFPSGERSWNSFTPRASIKYDISPSANVYFSYSQGFKSGVFDATSPAGVPVVDPEKLYAYEVGFKGRVADWLNLTAAGYYYDYKDIQIVFFVDGPGGLPLASLGNVGGAKIKGFELDANMNFGRHFDARIGLNYLDTKYNGFDAASVAVPNGQTYCVSACGTADQVQGRTLLGVGDGTGTHTEGYDANGNSLIHAPNFTIYGTANFHADVAGGILDVSGTIYHSSTLFFTFDHRVKQPSWENIDARIAWSPADDKFTVAVFGKNLTNKAVLSGTFIQAAADGVSYSPPRTYGVELDVRF